MRVWTGYGSEHSSNLVMIGRFKTASEAHEANEVLEVLRRQVERDLEARHLALDGGTDRFTDGMRALLWELQQYTLTPIEQEQFAYEVRIERSGREVVLTTDEIDVSGFLKVLIAHGARVEVYSAHDHPGTGHGRG